MYWFNESQKYYVWNTDMPVKWASHKNYIVWYLILLKREIFILNTLTICVVVMNLTGNVFKIKTTMILFVRNLIKERPLSCNVKKFDNSHYLKSTTGSWCELVPCSQVEPASTAANRNHSQRTEPEKNWRRDANGKENINAESWKNAL